MILDEMREECYSPSIEVLRDGLSIRCNEIKRKERKKKCHSFSQLNIFDVSFCFLLCTVVSSSFVTFRVQFQWLPNAASLEK